MKSPFNQIHYFLMTQIDGDNSDRFMLHVDGIISSYNRATDQQQLAWAACYINDQLASSGSSERVGPFQCNADLDVALIKLRDTIATLNIPMYSVAVPNPLTMGGLHG